MMAWKTVAQDVEEKTQAYWRVSQVWNRSTEIMPTGEAIVICKDNMLYTNPERPVMRHTERLLAEIVKGEGAVPPDDSILLNFPVEYISALNALDQM